MKFNSMKFWNNVALLKDDCGIGSVELSEKLGRSPVYISKMQKQLGCPTLETALAMADIFGTTVEELAYGTIGLERKKQQLEKEIERIQAEIDAIKAM